MNLFVTILLLFASYPKWLKSEEISCELVAFMHDETLYCKEVVTSKKDSFSITILNALPVLRVGMLQIDGKVYYFEMKSHELQEIEPGAFDNQNITEWIRLNSNNLTVIRSGTFKSLEIKLLDLSDNNIAHIEENAITDLPNLKEVDLSRNKMGQFHDNSFVNTPRLWTVDMSYNNLAKLGAKCFNFMKQDDRVATNEFETVNLRAFPKIAAKHLSLHHNKLKTIPEEVFTGNDIHILELQNNQLETLPHSFYNQKSLFSVNITENPLRCDVQNMLKEFNEKVDVFAPTIFLVHDDSVEHKQVVLYNSNC